MPTEKPDIFLKKHRKGLERELEALGRMASNAPDGENNGDGCLAVLRVFNELDAEKWPELAERYGLQDWLALPLDPKGFPLFTQLQKLIEDLAYQGRHDPMTGLPNRRAFEIRVNIEIERAKRKKQPVCLAIFDLDDFKMVNDTYGHPKGDEVLTAVSRTLVDNTRRYDVSARIGGEEFALFLPDTGLVKARATVNRVLESVRKLRFSAHDGKNFKITCSAGAVCWKARSLRNPPDLYELADQALYEAKSAGKDRLEIVSAPENAERSTESMVRSAEKQFLFTGS